MILEEESEGGSGVEAGPQTSPQLVPTEESGASEAAMRPGLPKVLGTLACTDRGVFCLFVFSTEGIVAFLHHKIGG